MREHEGDMGDGEGTDSIGKLEVAQITEEAKAVSDQKKRLTPEEDSLVGEIVDREYPDGDKTAVEDKTSTQKRIEELRQNIGDDFPKKDIAQELSPAVLKYQKFKDARSTIMSLGSSEGIRHNITKLEDKLKKAGAEQEQVEGAYKGIFGLLFKKRKEQESSKVEAKTLKIKKDISGQEENLKKVLPLEKDFVGREGDYLAAIADENNDHKARAVETKHSDFPVN